MQNKFKAQMMNRRMPNIAIFCLCAVVTILSSSAKAGWWSDLTGDTTENLQRELFRAEIQARSGKSHSPQTSSLSNAEDRAEVEAYSRELLRAREGQSIDRRQTPANTSVARPRVLPSGDLKWPEILTEPLYPASELGRETRTWREDYESYMSDRPTVKKALQYFLTDNETEFPGTELESVSTAHILSAFGAWLQTAKAGEDILQRMARGISPAVSEQYIGAVAISMASRKVALRMNSSELSPIKIKFGQTLLSGANIALSARIEQLTRLGVARVDAIVNVEAVAWRLARAVNIGRLSTSLESSKLSQNLNRRSCEKQFVPYLN